VATGKKCQPRKRVLVLILGKGGGGWWVSKGGGNQRGGAGWWWLMGIEGSQWQPERSANPENERLCSFRGRWWQPERSGNPENEHVLLVFRVEGGGDDKRKVTRKRALVLVSGLGGDGWCAWKGGGGDQGAKDVLNPENKHSCLSSGLGG
jgi:hypothetical protein